MNIILHNKRTFFVGDTGEKYEAIIRQMYLEENDEAVTKEYFSLYRLFDDYYMVSDYINIEGKTRLKFGVIELSRDELGKIIPKKEKEIIPLSHDLIRYGNLKTIIASVGKRQTYIELDILSKNYCKNIVPPVLEKAMPFDEKYPGFAECTYNGRLYFLPREMELTETLKDSMLLTEEQVKNKHPNINNSKKLILNKRKK